MLFIALTWNKVNMNAKWSNRLISERIDSKNEGRRYAVRHFDDSLLTLPSMTTVLDETMPEEKRQVLNNWRKRVGEEEAEKIRVEATTKGENMHFYIEQELLNTKEALPQPPVPHFYKYKEGFLDANNVEAKLVEAPLYWYCPKEKIGFAGTVDLVAIVNGVLEVVDHKSSSRVKKEEWITDYKLQVSGYAKAIEYLYSVTIEQARINIATSRSFNCFSLSKDDLNKYWQEFYKRLKEYNFNKNFTKERITLDGDPGRDSKVILENGEVLYLPVKEVEVYHAKN